MNTQLFFTKTGAGDAIFLLHGNGEDHTWFDKQIEPLSQYRTVFAVDTRGHGRSPRGDQPFTLDQFADDLRALMDTLRIPQADLLGYSDGGNIALLFALRYPARVKRMILSGANLRPSGMKLPVWMVTEVQFAGLCIASLFSCRWTNRRERFGLMAAQPHITLRALRSLDVPTLVVAGTRDLIRDRHTRSIAKTLPKGKLAILEGGHGVSRESPEVFNQAVIAFLNEPSSAVMPLAGATPSP